jgi:general secretion pathway protein D
VSYLDVGLKLDVEPSVLLDNDIVLKVALEVSSVANQVSGPDGSVAYNVGTRQTSTSLRLKDGETEVLAGLIQDDDRKTAAGVPGLSEIPLLGALFGVRGNTHDKTEIVMLITPHIVRNVSLPPIASATLDSGTDAQPGAPALRLSDDSARAGIDAAVATTASAIRPVVARESEDARPPAPEAVPTLNGPQDVASGSSFQVSVGNPGAQPMDCKLTFDANVLQSVAPTARVGEVTLQVGAGASQSVGFVVKPTVSEGSTTISSSTGETLTIALHPPAATNAPSKQRPDDAAPPRFHVDRVAGGPDDHERSRDVRRAAGAARTQTQQGGRAPELPADLAHRHRCVQEELV